MPQDVRELGRRVKAKYPGKYDDLDDGDLGRRVKAKYPGAYDDFTDAPAAQPEGILSSFQTGVAGPLLRNVVETATDIYNRPGETLERAGRAGLEFLSAFDPAGAAYQPTVQSQAPRMAELRRRAEAERPETVKLMEQGMQQLEARPRTTAGKIAFGTGRVLGEVGFPINPETAVQNIATAPFAGAAVRTTGQAFRAGVNAVRRSFGKGAAQVIEAEAAPIAREAIPAVGEAAPIQPAASLDTVFAKLETDNVEQIGAIIANANKRLQKNITPEQRVSAWEDYNRLKQLTADEHRALSQVLPARNYEPVGIYEQGGYSRNISDIPAGQPNAQLDANLRELEAFFTQEGRAAGPPPLEAEFGVSAASPSVRAASASVTGPSASAPLDALNVAVSNAADSVPRPALRRAKDELLGLLGASKSLRSTGDASYPLRQGALLLLRPLQWRQAAKVWAANFRAFRTKNFDAIKEAIDNHPLTERMDTAGLQRFPQAGEEAFARRAGSKISEAVQKAPIVKQSEQSYTAAAATQRVQAFEQYARLIDKAGLSPEQALIADKAAAQWINIATGRGSLGKRIDKAFEALNFAFFSPRYVASRLNVFNPAMYIRNASSPGGRVVLKQQMSDLMQFASVVATTMYLAKQAGADVGLNPKSPDFMKIKFGNYRYDLGAGLTQVMRLIYRVGADIGRAGRGEKPKAGQTATDIAQTFLSYKLSPPAGVFRDFINQRTVDKKPFSALGAARDLTVPMQWADFVEAYQKEAWGGVAKTLPGAVGVGVQNYESPPVQAAIDKAQPLLSELQRLNKRVSELRRKEGEKDDAFNARVQQFSANYTRFGQELLHSPRFQSAPDELKAIALERLDQRAKAITNREFAFPEIELDANLLMDAAEQSKKNPANK